MLALSPAPQPKCAAGDVAGSISLPASPDTNALLVAQSCRPLSPISERLSLPAMNGDGIGSIAEAAGVDRCSQPDSHSSKTGDCSIARSEPESGSNTVSSAAGDGPRQASAPSSSCQLVSHRDLSGMQLTRHLQGSLAVLSTAAPSDAGDFLLAREKLKGSRSIMGSFQTSSQTSPFGGSGGIKPGDAVLRELAALRAAKQRERQVSCCCFQISIPLPPLPQGPISSA